MPNANMQDLMDKFGQVIGIEGLCFDDDGYCCLLFDDLVLNMELDEELQQLFFYTTVGSVPSKGTQAFYELLLEANAYFSGTGGAALGVDKTAGSVVLSYKAPYSSIDFTAFQKMVENYLNLTEWWIKKIDDFSPDSEEKFPGPGPLFEQGIRV